MLRRHLLRVTLDPGTVITFVAELATPDLPQIYLWQPEAYKDTVNAFTLYRGIVLGIAGLLAVFLTILFVVKGTSMLPATVPARSRRPGAPRNRPCTVPSAVSAPPHTRTSPPTRDPGRRAVFEAATTTSPSGPIASARPSSELSLPMHNLQSALPAASNFTMKMSRPRLSEHAALPSSTLLWNAPVATMPPSSPTATSRTTVSDGPRIDCSHSKLPSMSYATQTLIDGSGSRMSSLVRKSLVRLLTRAA